MKIPHIPVLLEEIANIFQNINDGYIIDCTLGYGGHSEKLLQNNSTIKLICNDQDQEAINFSQNRLQKYSNRIIWSKNNFQNILSNFKDKNIKGILADIGVSSLQLDKLSRGFSFKSQTLDMRMNQDQNLNAKEIINHYPQTKLENIFKNNAQVKEYKKVASLVVQNRPFNSAKELADLISNNMHKGKIHPATLPFQAIRIEVNQELSALKELLHSIEQAKPQNSIIAIISFHSLEDKIVKEHFKKWSRNCICPKDFAKCQCGNNNKLGTILTKKPITPSNKEIKSNPRSKSAKLRIFKFD